MRMRDRYLFKAKRLDTNDWILGFLSMHKTGKYFIRPIGGSASSSEEVEKNTICQCTGLEDKNGKLIWENDVVRVTINSGSTICRCAFADTVAHFQLWQKYTIKSTSTVLNLGNYECEVIGNIFDNKELLESE